MTDPYDTEREERTAPAIHDDNTRHADDDDRQPTQAELEDQR